MDKIRILLCCGAGMSSGFLAQQMRIAAKKMNVVAKIEAKNKNSVQDDVNAIDLLLLGPHLEYVKAEMTQLCEPYHVPVIVIPKEMYAGLVTIPHAVMNVNQLPMPICSFLATHGDFRVILLEVVLFAVSWVIWYPFFKAHEMKVLKEEEEA